MFPYFILAAKIYGSFYADDWKSDMVCFSVCLILNIIIKYLLNTGKGVNCLPFLF